MRYANVTGFLCVAGLLTAMLVSTATAEGEKTHEGVVVSAGAGKLVMTTDGKEHAHKVSATTKITVNGKPGKLDDLKKGMKIKVMTDKEDEVLSISTVDDKK